MKEGERERRKEMRKRRRDKKVVEMQTGNK